MISYEAIKQANGNIITTSIKGKDYAEVNQRIKAFRMVFPDGFIKTEFVLDKDSVCVFKASCGYYENGNAVILGTGYAYEKEGSSFINENSYIENCETSAVGRALGMCGFGIDTSVASAEEVKTAILNQKPPKEEQKEEQKEEPKERKASAKQIEILTKYYTGANFTKLLQVNNIEKIEDISMKKASYLISQLRKGE